MQTFLDFFSQKNLVHLTGLSQDIAVLLAIFLPILLYAIFRGKSKVISLLISSYISAFIFSSTDVLYFFLPFNKNAFEIACSKALVFAVFALILHFILNKFIHAGFSMSKTRGGLETFLLSLVTTGFIVEILYKPLKMSGKLYSFSPYFDKIFASQTALVVWLLLPLTVVFLISRREI